MLLPAFTRLCASWYVHFIYMAPWTKHVFPNFPYQSVVYHDYLILQLPTNLSNETHKNFNTTWQGPGHGPFRRNFVWEEALWPRSFATCATLFGTRSFSSTSEAMRWRSGFSSRSSTGTSSPRTIMLEMRGSVKELLDRAIRWWSCIDEDGDHPMKRFKMGYQLCRRCAGEFRSHLHLVCPFTN